MHVFNWVSVWLETLQSMSWGKNARQQRWRVSYCVQNIGVFCSTMCINGDTTVMGHYKRTISIAFHCIRWCRALHSIAKHHCIARVDCTGPSINEGTGRWIRGHHLPLTCRYPIVLVDRAEIFSVYIFEICCKTIVCLFSAETTIESPSTLKLNRYQAGRRSKSWFTPFILHHQCAHQCKSYFVQIKTSDMSLTVLTACWVHNRCLFM